MVDEKPWYLSKTIWGSLVAIAAALASALGVSLDAASQAEITEVIVQLAGAAGALIAIYGRLSATDIIA
ncbi:MAG: hypothetical protein KDJ80_11585 [Nitratireductor sp.]|nr:hypothetical protein [Nitratireductor sp.]